MRTTRTRPRALTPINHRIQPQQRNNNYSLTMSHGVISVTLPWSSIVAIACAVIAWWLCYSVSGSVPAQLTSAALSIWVTQMATIVTKATPSGTHGEGGAVDTTTALQAFTAMRLRDAPK
eukprot:5386250-Amphidinium_carterae.1